MKYLAYIGLSLALLVSIVVVVAVLNSPEPPASQEMTPANLIAEVNYQRQVNGLKKVGSNTKVADAAVVLASDLASRQIGALTAQEVVGALNSAGYPTNLSLRESGWMVFKTAQNSTTKEAIAAEAGPGLPGRDVLLWPLARSAGVGMTKGPDGVFYTVVLFGSR